MKRLLLVLFSLYLHSVQNVSGSEATENFKSLLPKLKKELSFKNDFDDKKLLRIERLEHLLTTNDELNFKYNIYLKLYEEYKSFNFQKAFNYAIKLQNIGRLLQDPGKVAYGKIKLGFILLSSGMFKETFDSLKTIHVNLLPPDTRKEYYLITARTYYDLSDYTKDDYYTPIYNLAAAKYIDSALALYPTRSFEFLYYNGLKYLKAGHKEKAAEYFQKLVNNKEYKLSNHQFAVTASTLSDIFIQKYEDEKAIVLLIEAAIADIRSSTKEAAALGNLAQLLHRRGDVDDAYIFIRAAMDDADYYGARQRKIQMGATLPLIAGQRIINVEEQRQTLSLYVSLLAGLSIILVIFAMIIFKQLQKIKIADKVIVEANHNLKDTINKLDEANKIKEETINKLDEANKIKEEYIGYYFNLISEYIEKLEKFKRSVDNKLTTKRYEDIRILVDNIHLKKERDELFINFDKAFLKIFPNFVSSFNGMFSDENKILLLPNQLLNTDLRIFALIRLGINDTEKIAHILGYSLNTIYNYKARLKCKSTVLNGAFEEAVMKIKAF